MPPTLLYNVYKDPGLCRVVHNTFYSIYTKQKPINVSSCSSESKLIENLHDLHTVQLFPATFVTVHSVCTYAILFCIQKIMNTLLLIGLVLQADHECSVPGWEPPLLEEVGGRGGWVYQGRTEYYVNCHIQVKPISWLFSNYHGYIHC